MDRYLDGSPPPRDGGWLDTGDLGFIFEGELYITGRAKDVLVIRGRNHDPATLEAALDDIAGVRTGCSAAVAQISGTGEQILLFIETRGVPASGLAETCEQAVQAATGVRPNQIILLSPGTLPRTSSGKIRRAETLRRWKQGELTAPESVGVIKLTQAVVQSAWSEWRDRPRRHD
jgi:acyl-CoA synthetase (AMP-forming)/AMP-acid ligase II